MKEEIATLPKVHKLKTWPKYFLDVREGVKTFEFRKNDRDFKVGDFLLLQEFDPFTKSFTGNEVWVKVTYKLDGGGFGLDAEHCVLSIALAPFGELINVTI